MASSGVRFRESMEEEEEASCVVVVVVGVGKRESWDGDVHAVVGMDWWASATIPAMGIPAMKLVRLMIIIYVCV